MSYSGPDPARSASSSQNGCVCVCANSTVRTQSVSRTIVALSNRDIRDVVIRNVVHSTREDNACRDTANAGEYACSPEEDCIF